MRIATIFVRYGTKEYPGAEEELAEILNRQLPDTEWNGLRMDPLRTLRGQPVCLGHIDGYNEPVDVYACRSRYWLRSCFLMLPPSEVKALRTLVSVREPALFFTGDPAEPFRDLAPLSDNYRRYIRDWIDGQDIGQGLRWHSALKLTAEPLASFEQKVVAILNEHLVAIRSRAQGCRLADVTWLAGAYGQTVGERVPWRTEWRRQLPERAADRVAIA